MANNQPGNIEGLGFINKQFTGVAGASGGNSGIGTASNYGDVTSLRTALQAANGAYYTNALLNIMSVNDMVYALRTINNGTASNGSI